MGALLREIQFSSVIVTDKRAERLYPIGHPSEARRGETSRKRSFRTLRVADLWSWGCLMSIVAPQRKHDIYRLRIAYLFPAGLTKSTVIPPNGISWARVFLVPSEAVA